MTGESADPATWNVEALTVAQGHVYIGGRFMSVGGLAHDGLAEIDADSGRVDTWSPQHDGYGVTALSRDGDVLYVGGGFSSFEGRPRQGLAAVDAKTHDLLAWKPSLEDGWLTTTANDIAAVGQLLAVAGDFRSAGSAPHTAIALVARTTGSVLPWRPPPAETASDYPNADTVAASPTILAFDGGFDSINIYHFTPPG